jgi:hypothetical protein
MHRQMPRGTNPAVSLPRADHARDALRKLDLFSYFG